MVEQKLLTYKVEDGETRHRISSDINQHLQNGWLVKFFTGMPGDQHVYASVFVILERERKNKIG